MNPDDEVCLCFHVSLRKIRTFLSLQHPPVPSLVSECFGAGTGCRWCVPFLKHLHQMHVQGKVPDLRVSPAQYAVARLSYHATHERDPAVVQRATDAQDAPKSGEGDAPGTRAD